MGKNINRQLPENVNGNGDAAQSDGGSDQNAVRKLELELEEEDGNDPKPLSTPRDIAMATPRPFESESTRLTHKKEVLESDAKFRAALSKKYDKVHHTFKENLDFLKTEQYRSRAVGGQEPMSMDVFW